MEQPRVGFALTGSFCTLDKALLAMEETAAAYPNIVPILSETTGSTDTRFGRGADFRQAAEEICKTVSGHWEQLAGQYGLSRGAVEYMRPAFSLRP